MFRTPLIAALTVALLGTTAMAQPANAPANLSDSARNAPDYDDDDAAPPPRGSVDAPPPRDYAGPPPADSAQRNSAAQAQQAQADRDVFCRRDAAARTGYTTPREAARDEQTRGTVGGTLGGAALGAILGAAGGNAGLGAAAGAGAGLIAGTAIGADNARHAARSVEADYADAYYGCMHEDQQAGYYPNGAPRPAYAYPYYGPSVSFGFGFGGGHGWGGRGWGGRGFHGGGGGWRHH